MLFFTGKYKEALNLIEQNIIVRRRLYEDTHPSHGECLVWLGRCLLELGKYHEAQLKFSLALDNRLVFFSSNDLRIAEIIHYQGILQGIFCHYTESMELLMKAKDIREKESVENHPDIGDSMNAIADLKTKQGYYNEAEMFYVHAMLIHSLNIPEGIATFPKISETKTKQCELYRYMGLYEKSKILIDSAMEDSKVIYGKEHPRFLTVQQEYANVLRDMSQYEDSEKYAKRSLKHRKTLLGDDHPDYAYSLLCLAETYRRLDIITEARVFLTEAVTIYRMLFADIPYHTMLLECSFVHANIELSILEKDFNRVNDPLDPEQIEQDRLDAEQKAREEEILQKATEMDGDDGGQPTNTTATDGEKEQTGSKIDTSDQVLTADDIMSSASQQAAEPKSPKVIKAPVFNNGEFTDVLALYENIGKLLPSLYTNAKHPMFNILRGNVGFTMLLEYQATQRFFDLLSTEEKEAYRAEEQKRKQKQKEIRVKPQGLIELEEVVKLLTDYPLDLMHWWVVKFQLIVSTVVFSLDDMDNASNMFIEAETLRKQGNFFEADQKYDTVFLTQMQCLGTFVASTSLVVAETLYGKAENTRMLGNMELSKVLYDQSISIFRKKLGNDNEGVMKGILGLTEILIYHGMFEDALSMHQRAMSVLTSLLGPENVSIARLLTSLANDYLRLGKLDKAMTAATQSLTMFNKLLEKEREPEDLVAIHVTIAYISLQQAIFDACLESINIAKAILEKAYKDPENMISNVDILQCHAEYYLIIGKPLEAHKIMTRVMKMRINAFGRSNNQDIKSIERRNQFLENFDHLSLEAAENSQNDDDDEENKPKKPKVKTKFDNEEKALEDEMTAARSSIFENFGEEIDNQTVGTTLSKFGKIDNSAPAFVYRNRPVASHPIIAQCLYLRGKICLLLSEFSEAKDMFDGSLAMMNKLFTKPSQRKLSISYEIGNLIYLKGNFEEARDIHVTLLQQRLQLCDDEHPDKADSLYSIAMVNNALSKYDDSTQILTDAVTIRQKVYGESHWKVAEVFISCAEVLHAKGFYNDSNALFDKALVIMQKTFGEMHLLISNIFMGQAMNARELGMYDQAISYVEQATTMRTLLLGETNPDTALCHYHMALINRCKGKVLETKRLLDLAIVGQREKLGKYHPQTITTLLHIAINFMEHAKYQTAEHVYNRAIQLIKKSFGKDHILVSIGLTGFADNLFYQGKYDKAKENYEKAIYLRRKILGENHVLVAESIMNLAELHYIYARYDEATRGFDDALAILRMCLGENHPTIATAMQGLGKVMLVQGKVSDAKFTFERSLSMRKQILGVEHPLCSDSQYWIAQVYRKYGKLDQAAALFERCLNTTRDSRGSKHPMVATILCQVGDLANTMGKYVYAKETLTESLHIRIQIFRDLNENHPDIVESYFGIAENMRLRGLYIDVSKLKKKENVKSYGVKHTGLLEKQRVESAKAVDPIGESYLQGTVHNTGIAISKDDPAAKDLSLLQSFEVENISLKDLKKDNQTIASTIEASASNINTSVALINSIAEPAILKASDESTIVSAPTVMISAIERLDAPRTAEEIAAMDDYSIPGGYLDDGKNLLEELGLFKAMPLYEKVLDHYLQTFDAKHPLVMQTKHYIAETFRHIGDYEKSIEMHEEILTHRRKECGDTHPDTVLSMLGLGDILRAMSKIYPDNPQGSLEAKHLRKGKEAISLGVTLIDHLSSIVKPPAPLPSLQEQPTAIEWYDDPDGDLNTKDGGAITSSRHGGSPRRAQTAGGSPMMMSTKQRPDAPWFFISKQNKETKKKEVLKIPKGYMGYQFPPPKKIVVQDNLTKLSKPKKQFSGDAKLLYEQGINIQKRLFGDSNDHPITASLLYSKAELLRARRDYGPALQFCEYSLIMRRKLFRGTHPSIADCLNCMAEILRLEGKYTQAAPLYEKALEIRRDAFEGNHPSIAEVKNNIAMLLFAQGKYQEAQGLFEDSLNLCEEMLGPMHPATALSLNNLAGLHHSAGNYKLALEMYQRSLKIKQKAFGVDSVDVASTLNNIGLVHRGQGHVNEALDMFEQALEIQRNIYGYSHPDVATTMNNLAALYVTQGKKYEAKDLYKQSILIRCSIYGLDHPTVAATKNNYGVLLYNLEEYDEAKDMFEDALRIRMKVLGDEHPAVAETMNNMGLLLFTQGYRTEALPLYERALEIKIAAYGQENASVATSINNLAGLHYKLGDFMQAKELYQRAYDIRLALLGENHVDTKSSLDNIQSITRDQKKLEESRAMKHLNNNNSNNNCVN